MEILTPHSEPVPGVHISGDIQFYDEKFIMKFQWEDTQNNIFFEAQGSPSRTTELWKSTCFEAFFQPQGQSKYFEINLAATGAWDAYEFESYREPQPPKRSTRIQLMSFKKTANSLEASFFLDSRPSTYNCSLTVVIELKDRSKHYFALKHTGKKPDFHLSESFILGRNSK
jgi:hypothetical protein